MSTPAANPAADPAAPAAASATPAARTRAARAPAGAAGAAGAASGAAQAETLSVTPRFRQHLASFRRHAPEKRTAEGKILLKKMAQILRDKGAEAMNWVKSPEALAGLAEAVDILNQDAEDVRDHSDTKKAKLTTEDIFNQQVLPKIMFVISHYANGVFDEQVTTTEEAINNVMNSANPSPVQFAEANRQLSGVQSASHVMILMAERLRGQLMKTAIKKFATAPDGTVDHDAKKPMLREIFGVCPDTANKIIKLSDLFLVYPRLMFVTMTPADFKRMDRPLKKWLEANPDQAAELQLGFGAVTIAAGISLNDTEADITVSLEKVTPAERQYIPSFEALEAFMMASAARRSSPAQQEASDEGEVDDDDSPVVGPTFRMRSTANRRTVQRRRRDLGSPGENITQRMAEL